MKRLLVCVATVGYILVTATGGAVLGAKGGEQLARLDQGAAEPGGVVLLTAGLFAGALVGGITGAVLWHWMYARVNLHA